MISDYCRKCGGEGRIRVKKSVKVKIPAGVNDGSTLRVRGEGDAGPRGYVSCTLQISTVAVSIISFSLASNRKQWL